MEISFNKNIIDGILNSINNYTDNNAMFIQGVYYTFNDLSHCISKIRIALKEKSINSKTIGLVVNDDIETYASIFALWFEGKSYVPLHPNQPIERCFDIINQVSISIILDSSKVTKYSDRNVILTKKLYFEVECLDYSDIYCDNELAYILFTSGSTGQPKGVQITRKNLSSFISSLFSIGYNISETDRALQCFDLTFDLSIVSFLMPLLKGACCYTVPLDEIKYSYIYNLIDEYNLTVIYLVPSTIKYWKPYFNQISFISVRYCHFCGEALPLDLLEEWSMCIPNALIDNFYGPTEDTIYCSFYRYNRNGINKSYNGSTSIGKPMAGCIMKIMNEQHLELKVGEFGELCLAGDQLSSGYWENLEKNRDSFFIKDGIRYYKSGDECFMDIDGDFMYVGRLDFQTKIQGYRVELGEIEFYTKVYLKDLNNVALAIENNFGNVEIITVIESPEFEIDELVKYLKSVLPIYMIPSKFCFVPVLPLNANGKLDRNKLKMLL